MSKYKLDSWNPWTKKSSKVPFKRNITQAGVGHGEAKLGKELNTVPMGQNASYDLKVNNEKWEVKTLDSESSVRLGVAVAIEYNELRHSVLNCFIILNKMNDQLLSERFKKKILEICEEINKKDKEGLTIIERIMKNEVSEPLLNKINGFLEYLKKIIINFQPKKIEMYSSLDGEKYEYSSLIAVKKINLENISKEKKLKIFKDPELYDKNLIHSQISEYLEIIKKQTLKEKLNDIVRTSLQGEVRLVLVHKNKGYKPISNNEKVIFCNRITANYPRLKYTDDS
tara:strand:+ start:1339 stop:2190 length:852 start_codon:yes stop_codon:yes gene_type:complete